MIFFSDAKVAKNPLLLPMFYKSYKGYLNFYKENPDTMILEVIGINGRMVHRQVITENEGKIDLRGKVSGGIYLFRLCCGTSITTRTIIIELIMASSK